MYIEKGDTVVLVDTDQLQLRSYLGQKWTVESVMPTFHPASAIISKNNMQASTFLRHLETVPPEDSPFQYLDTVRIRKPFEKLNAYQCNEFLIGKMAHIRGYDKRNNFYYIKCVSGETGWFPMHSLIPLNYRGEKFFYPYEKINYKNKIKTINKIKKTKFNWGQLLLIDGEWIHSSDVTSVTDL